LPLNRLEDWGSQRLFRAAGTDGVAFLRWSAVRTGSTRGISVYGPHTLYVASLAAVVLGEAFTAAKRIGLLLIVTGVLGIVWRAGGTIGSRQNIGHAMFIGAGLLWACYTVAMRKARLEGLHAAAIAAVASLITYVPVYAIIFGTSLFNAPWRDIALQAFVQGLLTAVISLMLYGRAVSILGASNGSAFAALA